ncbi:RimK family alpha-L-glutamate ligase [Thermodesulfobacteriota bacterium]
MNLTNKDFVAFPLENTSRPVTPEGKILSMHPVIAGDAFYWDRGVWDENLSREIQKARGVILPQTVERELYCLCKRLCPLVFPNYDLRFQWEGKVGDTLAFWAFNIKHPYTLVFPRVESLLGKHPDMDHNVPALPRFPFVLKGAHGGEGAQVWLIKSSEELQERLQTLLQFELQGSSGFVIQEYLPALERDLRVVVIGNLVVSYWRKAQGFLHNIAKGGEVDAVSDPDLQAVGREKVRQFCKRSGMNLAAFDLVFPSGEKDPFFLEINYTFGRTGLGGSENFYKLLQDAVKQWLVETIQSK